MRVVTCGSFDLLTPGHRFVLEKMKELGDELYVVVIPDEIIEKNKGNPPIFTQEERAYLVEGLSSVDKTISPYNVDGNNYEPILDLNPDIYAYGYDQAIPWLYGLMSFFEENGAYAKFVQINGKYNNGNMHSSIMKRKIRGEYD